MSNAATRAQGALNVPAGPATRFASWTAGNAAPFNGVRGIYINTAGTYTFTDPLTTSVTFTCVAGQILPITPATFTSGTAAVIALG